MSTATLHSEKHKPLIPKLRFPTFNGEWRKGILNDYATFFNGKAYKQEELLESGKYPVLRVGNLFTNNNWYYSDLELDNNKYIENDDLIYAWSASFGPRIWKGEKVIYHYHIWKVECNLKLIDRLFYFQILDNETAKMKANSSNGFALLHITKGTIENWHVNIPSLPEQQKIASFLSAVDEKIQQLSRKKELLEQYKKGVMQQLFSGKLRFKDENGEDYADWEEKKLGSVANIKRGASPRPITSSKWFSDSSKIGWVRISDVTKSNKYLEKTVQYLSAEGISKSRLIKKGSIIMSICATIGKPIYTNFEVCIHDGFVVFEKLQADREFLFYYLDKIQLGWYRYGQPGSQVNLNIEIVSNETMPYPSIAEQQKIAAFLSSIDVKIESISHQLNQTQSFKKGLLQQLFV